MVPAAGKDDGSADDVQSKEALVATPADRSQSSDGDGKHEDDGDDTHFEVELAVKAAAQSVPLHCAQGGVS